VSAPTISAVTPEQMAAVDRLMAEWFGVDVLQSMEHAGRAVAAAARAMLPGGDPRGRRVLILAGRGGNGGDGLAAGRHLHAWGAEVEARLAHPPERLNAPAARQLAALRALGAAVVPPPPSPAVEPPPEEAAHAAAPFDPSTGAASVEPAASFDLVVDALLGFGLAGPPGGHVAELIRLANAQAAPVLAVDLPSGLDGATGHPFAPCVRATRTITLGLPKTGLLVETAAAVVGSLAVADIGLPPEAYAAIGVGVGPLFALGDPIEVF
jgi:NAD(P)H-hydrate epimerase